MSSLFTGPVFEMARDQLTTIADHLGIAEDERDWLLYPKRAIVVTCPVRMEDNRTQVFIGYRVQHHLALAPPRAAPASPRMWTSAKSPRSPSG